MHLLITLAKHVHGWIILECPMFCPSQLLTAICTLQDEAYSDHSVITVALNFDQLPMAYTIERHKNKHINWKFKDVGLKCRFYQRLDSMLDADPWGITAGQQGHLRK